MKIYFRYFLKTLLNLLNDWGHLDVVLLLDFKLLKEVLHGCIDIIQLLLSLKLSVRNSPGLLPFFKALNHITLGGAAQIFKVLACLELQKLLTESNWCRVLVLHYVFVLLIRSIITEVVKWSVLRHSLHINYFLFRLDNYCFA